MRRRTTALLGGGDISEHDISLLSTATLGRALLGAGYRVLPVLLGLDGTWSLGAPLESPETFPSLPKEIPGAWQEARTFGSPDTQVARLRAAKVDVCVLGLHGHGGEDGSLQGFLETVGLPFTGSGVQASAVCVDKVLFKHVLRGLSLPTPASLVLERVPAHTASSLERLGQTLGFPVVVKPSGLGSSVGVSIAQDAAALVRAVEEALGMSPRVLLEQYIRGTEITCTVLGSGDTAQALPIIEIVPRHASWFDKGSKYDPGGADEICPARLPEALAEHVRNMAVLVHQAVGARGITRTDIILDSHETPWILESNTLPGMTAGSLVPKAAHAAGLSLEQLVTRLVEDALPTRSPPHAKSARAAEEA